MGRGVSLPLDSILEGFLFADSSGVHNLFDFEFGFSFNDVRGWFREVWSVELCFDVGSQEGGVEDVVYFPLVGEFQLVDDVRDFVPDFKGAISFWGQLCGWVGCS